MSFSIKSIYQLPPEEGKTYLFDANVWKYILLAPQNPAPHEKAYIDFFDAVINLAANPRCRKKPAIHVNGLILSEVYNALMKTYFEAFNKISDQVSFKEYRRTNDYNANLISIKSDLQAYKSYLDLSADLVHQPDIILSEMPAFSDFNDHYYYKIAIAKDFSVVTNDGDFMYPNVEIITYNRNLLGIVS